MDNAIIAKVEDILHTIFEKKPVSRQELVSQAEILLTIVMRIDKADSAFERMLNEVVDRYQRNVGIKSFEPNVIVDDPSSDLWFTSQNNVPIPYFERYRAYLREEGWESDAIAKLKLSCEKTLSRCADPKGNEESLESKKRGMVMGDVQAGKTANYLGLINMACDYGYRVVVLLAGLTNSLRKQTQNRVDFGFIGAYSNTIGGLTEYIGVGDAECQHYAVPMTNTDWDFKKFIQKNSNYKATDLNKPVILVVKKNAAILKSVYEWLQPGENISGDSILIIDDEADNASPNTKKTDYDPSAVNRRIRDIYNKFPIASYIGFTATPFANIFINPYDTSEDDQDLFPHDFIIQLNAPSTYFGSERVFPSDNDDLPAVIRILSTEELNFVPVRHKKDYIVTKLPESLKEAILTFLLNNVIRTLRKDGHKHRSMMVNVTALNDPQESVSDAIKAYIGILHDIIEQDAYKAEVEFIKNAEMNKLHSLYLLGDASGIDFYAPIRDEFSWVDIQKGLYQEIRMFEIAIINNRYSGDLRFDYTAHAEKGARVIVIGGFVLSRGLTLEGLCVSYYSRNASAYDTLLQMCRWFGYRPRYDDLCRVYLSQASIGYFHSVLDAIRDMKEQFREMELQGKKPRNFGLMVKESPTALKTSLLVTARNKMRRTQVLERYVNYGGVYSDTSKLFKSAQKNKRNLELVNDFILSQNKKRVSV
ncbi:MAG: Z1 domain-containing protein [Defluviitaleaceae bacterium]|nr:Z1 domain-containing protein [Defluviitaleaceae bacterium]